ncbi:hypothetical protein THAOC_30074, partial [Thalassiosira oceanica]
PKLGKMKISPLRRQKATSIKILQGLVVDDGVEDVVTVGSGPGGSTAPSAWVSIGRIAAKFGGGGCSGSRPLGPRTGTNGHNVFDTIIDD